MDNATLFNLLDEAFDDGGLQTFCMMYYPTVENNFGLGNDKRAKIRALITHCKQHLKTEELLTHIKQERPAMYAKYTLGNTIEPQKNPISTKKKILFICASPSGTNPLDFGKEFKQIKDAKQKGEKREEFEIEIETGVEADALINKLSAKPYPYIVHITMHSSKSEGLYFEDKHGKEKPVSVPDFKDIFEVYAQKHKPELVILSACNSILHAEVILPYTTQTIGTKDFFPDEIAILYAKKFYELLFDGEDISFAHAVAVLSIKQAEIPEAERKRLKTPMHEIPILLSQS